VLLGPAGDDDEPVAEEAEPAGRPAAQLPAGPEGEAEAKAGAGCQGERCGTEALAVEDESRGQAEGHRDGQSRGRQEYRRPSRASENHPSPTRRKVYSRWAMGRRSDRRQL